ncbi:MAG: hypothetical protein ACLUE7_11120 [Lachnospirales bacterium]
MDIKKNFIDGKWVDGTLGRNIEVVNPATGEVIALVSESSVDDVKRLYWQQKIFLRYKRVERYGFSDKSRYYT